VTQLPPYWIYPLQNEYQVIVKECRSEGDHFELVLTEDVIRPAGGGQAGDRGFLRFESKDIKIIDVIMKEKRAILVVNTYLQPNSKCTLQINMNWRRSMMRNHTAQHLLVASLKEDSMDIEVGQLWIDGQHGSVEILGKGISLSDILNAEKHVNQLILSSIEVTSEIVDSSSIDEKVRARDGALKQDVIRVVRVGEYDASACSGIHVTNTSDILIFKIINYGIQTDRVQVEFVTGERAVQELCQTYNMALKRKDGFPFEMEQLGAVIDKCKMNNEVYEQILDTLQRYIIEGPSIEKIEGVVFVHEYLPGFNTNRLREIVSKMKIEVPSALLLFIPGEKCNLIFRTDQLPYEAREYLDEIMAQLGGRGGGSKRVYSGGFINVEDPLSIYNQLVNVIEEKLHSK
jgi:alanyl-tRNA synthetase